MRRQLIKQNNKLRSQVLSEYERFQINTSPYNMNAIPERAGAVVLIAKLRKQVLSSSLPPQKKAALTRKLNEIIKAHGEWAKHRFGLEGHAKMPAPNIILE